MARNILIEYENGRYDVTEPADAIQRLHRDSNALAAYEIEAGDPLTLKPLAVESDPTPIAEIRRRQLMDGTEVLGSAEVRIDKSGGTPVDDPASRV